MFHVAKRVGAFQLGNVLVSEDDCRGVGRSLPVVLRDSLRHVRDYFADLQYQFKRLRLRFIFHAVRSTRFVQLDVVYEVSGARVYLGVRYFAVVDDRFEQSVGGKYAGFRRNEVQGDFRGCFVSCSISVPVDGAGSCLMIVFRLCCVLCISSCFAQLIMSVFSSKVLPLVAVSSVGLSLNGLGMWDRTSV